MPDVAERLRATNGGYINGVNNLEHWPAIAPSQRNIVLIPTPAAIAVALGANVGTTATALLASLRMNAQARRTAVANLLFNTAGVLAVLPFLADFADLAILIGRTPALGVAWAHLLFNGATAALALLLLSPRLPGGWVDRRWPATRAIAPAQDRVPA